MLLNKFPRRNIVRDGLVLWLNGKDFTNSPNCTSLRDRSGNGNNLTPSGFAYTASSGSDLKGGIKFDGVDDRLKTETVEGDNFSLTNKFTLLIKFKYTDSDGYLISKNNDGGLSDQEYCFYIVSRMLYISINKQQIVYTPNFIDWNVYTLAIVINGSLFSLYLNDTLAKTDTLVNPYVHRPNFNIGCRSVATNNSSGSLFYDTDIYDLLIYQNKALTQAEITQNYKALKGGHL